MNLYDLYVKIGCDTGEAERGIADVTRSASGMGEALASAAKVAATAIGAAGTAISFLGKQALSSFADYEQLTGGAELMFGDAYETVAENARDAYKTVQMSQNAYLAQVNGLATGLKTALDGNAQAAAELAHRVVQAEADVVAATGNSQEAIQNAFNGIMRTNYTMLDNLQLGITPTKEGFQELIDKVNEWNAANGKATAYQIENLADAQAALVDYIEMQGLAGYASMEASETIQGSVSAMKGAWENLMTALADPEADVGERLDALVDSGLKVVENVTPQLVRLAPRIADGLARLGKKLAPEVMKLVQNLLPSVLKGAASLLDSTVDGLLNLVLGSDRLAKSVKFAAASIGTITAGTYAYNTALHTVIPAVKSFLTLLSSNPVLGIATAASAAITLLLALGSEAGETAEQVAELTVATKEAADALPEINRAAEDTVAETNAALDAAEKYVRRLEELEGQSHMTAAEQEEYAALVERVRSLLPDVNLSLDEQTGLIEGGTRALRENAAAWKANAVEQALSTKRADLYAKQADVMIEKQKNQNELKMAQLELETELAGVVEEITAIYDAGGKAVTDWGVEEWNAFLQASDGAQALQSAYWEAQQETAGLQQHILALETAITSSDQTLAAYETELATLDGVETELTGTSGALASAQEVLAGSSGELVQRAQALRTAYQEAYQAALEMVQGSSKLFEDLSARSATSLSEMTANEQSRADFYEEYAAALNGALEKLPESMHNVVLSMSDLSEESLGRLQAIADGSDEEIAAMVAAMESTVQRQQELADVLAQAQQDFVDSKNEIVKEAEKLTEEMNQYDAMYRAGELSMQGYIDGLYARGAVLREYNAEMAAIPGANSVNIYQTFDSTATPSEIKGRTADAVEAVLK